MVEKLETMHEILSSIQLNLRVGKNQVNNFGGFNYRKAEDILLAVKEELKKDIYPPCFILTPVSPKAVGDRFFVTCQASIAGPGLDPVYADGWAELEVSRKKMDLAQLTGATTSYAKKYALGNLFAIDDSKDDPDADEEKAGLARAADEAMKEQFQKKNEDDFSALKNILESCGGGEELKEVWSENKKIVNSLKKWNSELYGMIVACKDMMKEQFEEEENESNI